MDVKELDYVWMISKFFEEHNFSESSLSICSVSEGIKDFLHSYYSTRPPIGSLPNNPIRSFTESSSNLIFLADMGVNIGRGLIV